MENQNEQQTAANAAEQKAPAVGGVGRSALAQAVLRATNRQPEQKEDHEEQGEGGVTSPEDAAASLLNFTDDSATLPGGTGEAEGEAEAVDVWQFNGSDYTATQVEESLRERETYQRYNQSVKPMIESVTEYGNRFEQATLLATTECDNQIAELTKALNSNQLNSQQYQAAHMQLRDAKARKTLLEQTAKEEADLRTSALRKIREQNARQSVTSLVRQGWKPEDIKSVATSAQQVIGEKFADVMSPELLQVFRDAAEMRNIKAQAAKKLTEKSGAVMKTTKQSAQRPQTATKGKPMSFGQKVWGDRYK